MIREVDNFRKDINSKNKRVVITLSTLPDRYQKLVKTLKSLKEQDYKVDEIYLSLPTFSVRMNIKYPPLNEEILKLAKPVYIEKDYGPITKLLGALYSEENSDTIIISCDDDYIYPKNFVSSLIAKHNSFPNSALGSSGMLIKYACPFCAIHPNLSEIQYRIPKIQIENDGRKVDILYGFSGVLYLRGFFPRKEDLNMLLSISMSDQDLFLNDDIVISAFLAKHGIERRIFKDIPKVEHVLNDKGIRERSQYELSYNLKDFMLRMNRAIEKCKKEKYFLQLENMTLKDSIFFKTTLLTLSVIIIIFLIFFLIFGPKEALGFIKSKKSKN